MQMCPAARVGRQSAALLLVFLLESQSHIRVTSPDTKAACGKTSLFCRCFFPDVCLCPYLQSAIRMVLRGPQGQWVVQWLCFYLSKCPSIQHEISEPENRLPCLVAQHPLVNFPQPRLVWFYKKCMQVFRFPAWLYWLLAVSCLIIIIII